MATHHKCEGYLWVTEVVVDANELKEIWGGIKLNLIATRWQLLWKGWFLRFKGLPVERGSEVLEVQRIHKEIINNRMSHQRGNIMNVELMDCQKSSSQYPIIKTVVVEASRILVNHATGPIKWSEKQMSVIPRCCKLGPAVWSWIGRGARMVNWMWSWGSQIYFNWGAGRVWSSEMSWMIQISWRTWG